MSVAALFAELRPHGRQVRCRRQLLAMRALRPAAPHLGLHAQLEQAWNVPRAHLAAVHDEATGRDN
eukprot:2302417-Pyramimonas_sp.AAC.1